MSINNKYKYNAKINLTMFHLIKIFLLLNLEKQNWNLDFFHYQFANTNLY